MNLCKTVILQCGLLLFLCLNAIGSMAAEGDLDDWVSEGKWRRGSLAIEPTPAKQLQRAKDLERIGDVRQAAEQFRRLAAVYTEADEAEEAMILSARNYLAAGSYTKCREQLEELHRRYVHTTYLDLVGQVQVSLARGYLDGKGEGGTYRLASRVRKAKAIYEQVMKEDPQGRWADDALLGLGGCEEALFQFDDAIKKYKELLKDYPRSELRAEAEGRIAYCINAREPQPEYAETETEEARRRIKSARSEAEAGDANLDLVALGENEQLLEDRQAQKRFEQAQFYVKNGHYRAAEVYLERIKLNYPDSKWAVASEAELKKIRQR